MKEILIDGNKIKTVAELSGLLVCELEGVEFVLDYSSEWFKKDGYNLNRFDDTLKWLEDKYPEGLKLIWKDSEISRVNFKDDKVLLKLNNNDIAIVENIFNDIVNQINTVHERYLPKNFTKKIISLELK
jgi:hypothetical protein